jgi:hypothetical protein
VREVDLPSLRWALPDYLTVPGRDRAASQEAEQGPDRRTGTPAPQPDYSPTQDTPNLLVLLRAGFCLVDLSAWSDGFPPDFFRWLVFRQAPVQQEQLILWARGDIFPGGDLATQDNSFQDGVAQPRE